MATQTKEPALHVPSATSPSSARPDSWAVQLRWFAGAAALGFVVPYVGSSVLGLQHDVYLGIYFAAVFGLFATYAVATGLNLREAFTQHWKLGVGLGVALGFLLVRNALSEDATPRPHGLYLVFELSGAAGSTAPPTRCC